MAQAKALCNDGAFSKVRPPRRSDGVRANTTSRGVDNGGRVMAEPSVGIPIAAQKEPYKVRVEAGQKYFWCACGRSKKQPYCDGSHKAVGLSPLSFTAEATKDVYLCGCKSTGNKPYCDGTHKSL